MFGLDLKASYANGRLGCAGGDAFTAEDDYHPDGDVGSHAKKKLPNMKLAAALKTVSRKKKERLSEFNQ